MGNDIRRGPGSGREQTERDQAETAATCYSCLGCGFVLLAASPGAARALGWHDLSPTHETGLCGNCQLRLAAPGVAAR